MVLMRHGATHHNVPSNPLVRGWHDDPLTDEGRTQVHLALDGLRKLAPKIAYSSDFMRDTETAGIVAEALNLPMETDYDARTWDVGVFSGKPEAEVNEAIASLYKQPWETPPGSSESFNGFAKRWLDFLELKMEMASKVDATRPPLIVTHGRNIGLAHSYIDFLNPWEADMPLPAGIATISVEDDRTLSFRFLGEAEPVPVDV